MNEMNFIAWSSRWEAFRFWLHRKLYKTLDITPASDVGGLLIDCSCGGCAQVWRADDGDTVVDVATCPAWILLMKGQQRVPKALARRRAR